MARKIALPSLALLLVVLVNSGMGASLPGVRVGPLTRALRGAKNILLAPLEIPATIARQSARRGPVYGLLAGSLEGIGNGTVRLAAGLVEFLTFPLPGVAVPDYTKHLGDRALPPIRPPLGITKP